MTDKNGKEMKTGDVVEVRNAYFKNDNGLFKIIHAPGDKEWTGNDYCLKKLNKDGTFSTAKYNLGWYPLKSYTNDWRKRHEAKAHNAQFATIEVIDFVPIKARKPQEGVKFLFNGIKVNGTLYKAHYSISTCRDEPEGTITIYARGGHLPRISGLNVQNDSDSQTDYFEYDRARVRPASKYYNEVKAAADKAQEKFQARIARKTGTAA